MGKVLLSGLLGAIVLFIWGVVSWTMLPWRANTTHVLPAEEEAKVVAVLGRVMDLSGVVMIPGPPPASSDDAVVVDWSTRHQAGPVARLVYQKQGFSPMSTGTFLISFLLNFVTATAIAAVVWASRHAAVDFAERVGVAALVGVALAAATHLMHWNWMYEPIALAVVNSIDAIIGFALVGVVAAAVLAEPRTRAADKPAASPAPAPPRPEPEPAGATP